MTGQLDMFAARKRARPAFLDDLDEGDPDGARYYQRECINSIMDVLRVKRSTLAVLATGLGKTTIFSAVAKHWPGRVLVLAHRDELIHQARKRVESATNEVVGVEQAEWTSGRERIVVGSVQTVCRDHRLERLLARGGFSLVIIDEAHHATARSYKKIIAGLGDLKLLGVTATPDRSDKEAMGQVFEEVAFSMDITDGIDAGYLVPIIGERVWVEAVDLNDVKSVAGDLNLKQLDEVMLKAVEGIVKETVSRWPDRCGPVFLPGKASAELACERFNALKPYSAAVVTDDTSKEDRRRIMLDVKAGRVQYLCNCMVATEGFDWPEASIVVCGRPTKSRSLYSQMVGRGIRVLPNLVEHIDGREGSARRRQLVAASSKPNCLVADFCGNSGKHALVGPEDILGGTYTPAEVQAAKKLAEKKPGADPRQNLNDARKQLQAMAAAMASKVKAKAEKFNPFAVLHMAGDDAAVTDNGFGRKPASQGQKDGLVRWGLAEKDVANLTKGEASRLLSACVVRKDKGLASYKQLRQLQNFGVTDVNISFERAKAAMNYIQQLGWGKTGKVDPAVLDRICNHRGE